MVRDKWIHCRVTESEKQAIEIMAKREARNISEMVRELVRESLQVHGVETLGLLDLLYGKADHGN